MTTTIGIVGLGQIGASIGLALRAKGGPERVLGHTRDADSARKATALGAVEAAKGLKDLARESDILFLCLPLSEMRRTLEVIGTVLKDNTVVVETAPVKGEVTKWMEELLPSGVHHIGIVPSLNPSMLSGNEFGTKAADARLFHRTIMMVVVSKHTPEAVEQLGMNIARVLGAKPMLTDPSEADGIMTTAHVLPQLTSAALIEACIGAGGWAEARKLAGRPFAGVTGGMAYHDDPSSIQTAVLSDPTRVVHGLDILLASLHGLRDAIAEHDGPAVKERLMHSYRAREQWLDERNDADWLSEGYEPVEMPGLGEQFTKMFFGGRIAEATRTPPPGRRDKR